MLVISRKEDQRIKIGDDIEIVIVSIEKNQVKIGIEAPRDVQILRSELIDEIKKENIKANKEIDLDKLKDFSKAMNEN
ncbi:carbon storage regulator CsrA [Caminibacter pacificus]|jgi:carbon storage regulator|uniref:Translational regulator CsrA n=1 Tax=Caminibacter pacificus TaxID=1424653 RepID=A0AAJ4RCE2_9BACT|nr:carbon storage regulator CsrA [Caminibacter pacificus]NPA88213.1 carbon storage regulator CsrA [Campylobacterota bacterium]QCI27825.1 carbon storage regulator CsrA [Caminibacter pacificus]ROR40000.1 carbon storage regulator CsrA [Caminibacter pacificus]